MARPHWHRRSITILTRVVLGFVVDPDTQSLFIHFRVLGTTASDALGQNRFHFVKINPQGTAADWGKMKSDYFYQGGGIALDPSDSLNIIFVFG